MSNSTSSTKELHLRGSRRFGRAWVMRRVRWRPATRVGRLTYRLLLAFIVLLFVQNGVPGFHGVAGFFLGLISVIMAPLLLILFWRFFTRRILWKVRNRLILTYLLMGLAPVLLVVTLAGIAAYLLMGQYATNTALTLLDEKEASIREEARRTASHLNAHVTAVTKLQKPTTEATTDDPPSDVSLAVLGNAMWKAVPGRNGASKAISPFDGQPKGDHSWLGPNFHGVVAIGGKVYLCSHAVVADGGRTTEVLGSIPFNGQTLNNLLKDYGHVDVLPNSSGGQVDPDTEESDDPNAKKAIDAVKKLAGPKEFSTVRGGELPNSAHFWDVPVLFGTLIDVESWATDKEMSTRVNVLSRPTVLYRRLFATSTMAGKVVQWALIIVALIFGVMEFFALLMAARLSLTITHSISELYQGTVAIDRGKLGHRIKIKRKDQLGALATSFNTMAASIGDLLVQQREKDRLVSELAIAQGVQEDLFPDSPIEIGALEVHAICKPARTVSGDYFDFIREWSGAGHAGQVCLALGDISGKGISAALLMASLHSAVRAFLIGDDGAISPGQILGQLNWHLFRSTQSNKYATLFLAFYDAPTRRLTYSNGGHLAPLVLSSDGSVKRLSCGGSVVGLLDELVYPEATVELQPGDVLMAFSDGLTEPENAAGEEFGEERLMACVRDNREKPLDALVHDTIHNVLQWIGTSEQPDDMTLLIARQL